VTPKHSELINQEEEETAKTEIQVEAIKSEGGIWAEEMELNWSQVAVRDDLLTLRNFFKQGMDFSVVEELVSTFFLLKKNIGLLYF
jgi:hypothetical protein